MITRVLLFLLCFGLVSNLMNAQSVISGHWSGTLTQYTGTGVEEYDFSLSLYEEDGKISGQSFVAQKGVTEYYAIESLNGSFDGKMLNFQEGEIIRQQKISENVVWCIKNGALTLSGDQESWILEGWWAGFIYCSICPEGISKCDDGFVILKKDTERASMSTPTSVDIRLKK